jgi:hypothetical protein
MCQRIEKEMTQIARDVRVGLNRCKQMRHEQSRLSADQRLDNASIIMSRRLAGSIVIVRSGVIRGRRSARIMRVTRFAGLTNKSRVLASEAEGAKRTEVAAVDAFARRKFIILVFFFDLIRGGSAKLMNHPRVLASFTEVSEPTTTLAIGAATGTRFIILVIFVILFIVFLFIFIGIEGFVVEGLRITSLFNRADIRIDEFTNCIVKLLLRSTREERLRRRLSL